MPTMVNLFRLSCRAQRIADDIRRRSTIFASWKQKGQQKPPSFGSPILQITVRNLGQDGQQPTDKTVYNWRAAWEIVDKALWPRRMTQVYVTDLPAGQRPSRYRGRWYIDFIEGEKAPSKGL